MILFFSGTGNSKYIADALADKLSDEVVSINEIVKHAKEKTFYSEKPYVIVAPIYAWRYPQVVEDFVTGASLQGARELYFVATMGENSGNCDKFSGKLAAAKGMEFKGFRGLVMPNNYILSSSMGSEEENARIVADALLQVGDIAAAIANKTQIQKTDRTHFSAFLSGPVHNMFSKHMCTSDQYTVNDACVSCGRCVELCAVNNVVMNADGKPTFGKGCINCLACIQYCPKQAINIAGKTENRGRYTCKKYEA